ncbi:MAG TPA: PPA1309 family protein [Nocardioides sp.]|uniref:PPA1309 family protein n=1 Tax=Nocardioides sp. TaxID=35761 RepID=UPI002F40B118
MSPDVQADEGLATAVLEIERHAAEAGWDQPARLFALVETAQLAEREPQLADTLGETSLTPIEQEGLAAGRPLEDQLTAITWPETVHGCAALVERVVLPPDVEAELPEEPARAASYAAEHPDRQEVRIVAAATRTGASYCAMRLRAHDDDTSVLTGPDLVPGLLDLVRATLDEPGALASGEDGPDE